jgi:SAM-dependent methyltransferase
MNSGPSRFRGYELRERHISFARRDYLFIGPSRPHALLDHPDVAGRFAADGYMPYWADFWPASLLLIDALAGWRPPDEAARAPTVLELGCGLGAVSVIVASLGYQVIASDYDCDALAFTTENARLNGVKTLQTVLIDWRCTYPGLRADRIVAAEVLYERRNAQPVAAFVRHHLQTGGFALICDRKFSPVDEFPDVARRAGLRVEASTVGYNGPEAEESVTGRLFRLALTGL